MQSNRLSGRSLSEQFSAPVVVQPKKQEKKQCRRKLQVTAAGSTYGTNFRVTTFGESHGKAVGCVIDGVPPRLPITQEEIQVHETQRIAGLGR
jgi:chorismate synthase